MAAGRILVSGVPPNSTPASPLTAQTARSPHRHPYPRSQRSSPDTPAALHSPIKPERSAIGAVICPRFPSSALTPPNVTTLPVITNSAQPPTPVPHPDQGPSSLPNKSRPKLTRPHQNTNAIRPTRQSRPIFTGASIPPPNPGPFFLSTQPMLRSGRLRHSSRSSFASPVTSTAKGNTKTRTTRLNQVSSFGFSRAASHPDRRAISESGFYREIPARRARDHLRFLLNLRKTLL